jgi:hypothetical protein
MSSFEDYVALLREKLCPFTEEEFRSSIALYRHDNSLFRGAALRQQVNLAACLYLEVNSERPSEPRVKAVGGWGSRNDLLADIARFHSGSRPATSVSVTSALPSISSGQGMMVGDALQIATSQGLEAAQKMIEASVKGEFESRLQAATEEFARRTRAFEEMVAEAQRRQEAAESQRLIIERKLDEALQSNIKLSSDAAAAIASYGASQIQTEALIENLSRERAARDQAAIELIDLSKRLSDSIEATERERRQQLLHLDASRQKDAQIDKIKALLEKEREACAALQVKIVQLTGANEALVRDNKRLEEKASAAESNAQTLDSFKAAIVAAAVEQDDVISKATKTLMQGVDRAVADIGKNVSEQSIAIQSVIGGKLQEVLALSDDLLKIARKPESGKVDE